MVKDLPIYILELQIYAICIISNMFKSHNAWDKFCPLISIYELVAIFDFSNKFFPSKVPECHPLDSHSG